MFRENLAANHALFGVCERYSGSVSLRLHSMCRHRPVYWTTWCIQDGDRTAPVGSWVMLGKEKASYGKEISRNQHSLALPRPKCKCKRTDFLLLYRGVNPLRMIEEKKADFSCHSYVSLFLCHPCIPSHFFR